MKTVETVSRCVPFGTAKAGDRVLLQRQNAKTPGAEAVRVEAKVLRATDKTVTTTHGRFSRATGLSMTCRGGPERLVDPGSPLPPPTPERPKPGPKDGLAGFKILVIGDRVWGKGLTLEEALRNASRPKAWQAFLCHEKTTVDGMGRVEFPAAYRPREVARRAVRPGGEFITFGGRNG